MRSASRKTIVKVQRHDAWQADAHEVDPDARMVAFTQDALAAAGHPEPGEIVEVEVTVRRVRLESR